MRTASKTWWAVGLMAWGLGGAMAQTVKVGIIAPFSGPFAHYGTLFKAGAEAYLASQGGKLAGQNIELIYRDEGGPNPANTKTLAQELVVKDKVDYLGGIVFSPNAFAVAPVIQESNQKKPSPITTNTFNLENNTQTFKGQVMPLGKLLVRHVWPVRKKF